MSLRDGTVKMGKSDPVDASRINLTDTPDVIAAKISKAKTDSISNIRCVRFWMSWGFELTGLAATTRRIGLRSATCLCCLLR
jgi:hypothetical protein